MNQIVFLSPTQKVVLVNWPTTNYGNTVSSAQTSK